MMVMCRKSWHRFARGGGGEIKEKPEVLMDENCERCGTERVEEKRREEKMWKGLGGQLKAGSLFTSTSSLHWTHAPRLDAANQSTELSRVA